MYTLCRANLSVQYFIICAVYDLNYIMILRLAVLIFEKCAVLNFVICENVYLRLSQIPALSTKFELSFVCL